MEDYGLVSVIMPAYNSARFISESIQSVLDQTYSNWELFIVDDASTDSTVTIAENYALQDARIHVFKNTSNFGTHYSRNKGIEASKGDFISFLDSDDLWKPHKLTVQLKTILKEDLASCFSSYDLITEEGELTGKRMMALPVLTYEKLLKANYVGNLTGLYRISKLGKLYCPKLRKRQDWALWLTVTKKGGAMKGITESLAYYRTRSNSISGNKLEMLKYNFQVYHKVLGYNLPESLYRMLLFLNEQFFVKSKQLKTTSVKK